LTQAEALLSREDRFFGMDAPSLELTGCQTHKRLLDAYAKVRAQFSATS
jgi:ribosomal protein S12 methylthiotransferase accessory factor